MKNIINFLLSIFYLTMFVLLLFFFCNNSFAQSIPITTDSRIRTLVYNPNEIYELKFYYNYQSFIEFSEDEEIEMISIGEAFAWRLTPAGKRLFIRPLEIAAHTNMTIITNRRTYHFDIRSGEYDGKADEELVYVVRFFYPQIGQPIPIPPQLTVPNIAAQPLPPSPTKKKQVRNVKIAYPSARIDEDLPPIIQRNPEDVEFNFEYTSAGKSDNIMPLKVYDNGQETSMQFANDNLIIPSISMVDSYGTEQQLNYTIVDGYVVVPVVARQFTLRLSDSLICIYNNRMIK
jgi:type IV secretion system protein VirB9